MNNNDIISKKKALAASHHGMQTKHVEVRELSPIERVLPVSSPINVVVVKHHEMQSYKNSSNSSSSEGNVKQTGGEFALNQAKKNEVQIKAKAAPVGKQKHLLVGLQNFNQFGIEDNNAVIKCLKQIGDGHQSKIYSADIEQTGNATAQCIKVFEPYQDYESEKSAEQEFKVAQALKGHPNIVEINRFEKNKPISIDGKTTSKDFMVMEFCKHGDMYDFMTAYTANQPASLKGLYLYDKQLLKALYV